MTWEERKKKGKEFENRLFEHLNNRPDIIIAVRNGTEHTLEEFTRRIRTNSRWSAKFIRHAPDGVVLRSDGQVYHIEAKNSKWYEKDSYQVHMQHHDCGCVVYTFFCIEDNIYYQTIESITFDNDICPFGWKKDSDGWLLPQSSRGSGTPCKLVNVNGLNKYIANQGF